MEKRWLISECSWESCLNIWKKKISIVPHSVHQNKFPMDLKVKYIKKKKDRIIEENLSEYLANLRKGKDFLNVKAMEEVKKEMLDRLSCMKT